jgi:CheY-like chemotaxis protein
MDVTNSSNHRLRLLVVEDDLAIRDAMTDFLEEEGYDVITAANGDQALRMLEALEGPILVILDLMMPVMDGFEFLRQLRARPWLPSHRVLVITAGKGQVAPAENVVGCLQKPFELDRLLSVIERERV